MSNYTCEACFNHVLVGENEEYEELSDCLPGKTRREINENHLQDYTIAGKNCPVPERYTKVAETKNMVLYKENNK